MTLADIITAATGALTGVIPAATLALYAGAGTVLAIAARFGSRIVRSLR